MNRFEQRRNKLRKLLQHDGLANLLVTDFTNVTYLTGFTGDDSYLLLTPGDAVMLTDGRYTEQLERECPDLDVEVRVTGVAIAELTERVVKAMKLGRLGLEADSVSWQLLQKLQRQLTRV